MIVTDNIKNVDELVIDPILKSIDCNSILAVLSLDFTFFPLIQKDWDIQKGKRQERLYFIQLDVLDENGNSTGEKEEILAIKDYYIYEFDGWEITSFVRNVIYYRTDGSVGVEVQIRNESSYGIITRLNREIKINTIDALRERGKGLRIQAETQENPYVAGFFMQVADATDSILTHYYDVIKSCYDFTWSNFINAIQSEPPTLTELVEGVETEVDNPIFVDLHIPASADGTLLVKHAILNDIV